MNTMRFPIETAMYTVACPNIRSVMPNKNRRVRVFRPFLLCDQCKLGHEARPTRQNSAATYSISHEKMHINVQYTPASSKDYEYGDLVRATMELTVNYALGNNANNMTAIIHQLQRVLMDLFGSETGHRYSDDPKPREWCLFRFAGDARSGKWLKSLAGRTQRSWSICTAVIERQSEMPSKRNEMRGLKIPQ